MPVRKSIFTGLVVLVVLGGGLAVTGSQALAGERILHEFSKSFGTSGAGNGEFNDPAKIAIDETTGDVYVADDGNSRVQKFDAEGNYISQFNGSETPNAGPGEFSPRYLAVDDACTIHEPSLTGTECKEYDPSAGDVYVVDTANNVVDKFSAAGSYLSRLPVAGGPVPRAVAVDPVGQVIVTSGEPGQIAAYDDALNNDLISSGSLDEARPQVGFGLAVRSDETIYFLAFESFAYGTNINGEGSGEEIQTVGSGPFGGGSSDLAFDLSAGVLYADIGTALRLYDQSYNQIEEVGAGRLVGSTGVAVNSTNHTAYAADPAGNVVDIFTRSPLAEVKLEPPSNIQSRSVTFNGTVIQTEGVATSPIRFEYGNGTGPNTTILTTPASCPASSTTCQVSATATGLQPNKLYTYRLEATNHYGVAQTSFETVMTTPAPPVIDSQYTPVTNPTTAELFARINPDNEQTTYHFEYGTSGAYGTNVPLSNAIVGSGFGDAIVAQSISDLQPNTEYHYRTVATNPTGSINGPDQTFTTAPATPPPTLGTATVTEASQNGASLTGTVNPHGVPTSYEFDIGVDTNYGTSVFGSAGFNPGPVNVTASFQGLTAGATYHYRLLANNILGTAYGPDQTFTTPAFAAATLIAPLPSTLVPIPTVAFPTIATGTSKPKTKKHPKRKTKKKKKGKKTRKATNHAHGTQKGTRR